MRVLACLLLAAISLAASPHHSTAQTAPPAEAFYIGNEGVMVAQGGVKVLFDPLYQDGFGQYRLVPEEMRTALLAGVTPFDDVDAIFISHAHGDHFNAGDIAAYLTRNPFTQLVAPPQALDSLRADPGYTPALEERLVSVAIDYGAEPLAFSVGDIEVEAVRIPHAGGPQRRSIENMLYRITLKDEAVVMHMGDADPNDAHFAPYDALWQKTVTDTAFPPYWFFLTPAGGSILETRLNVGEAVGVHVPAIVPPPLEATGATFFSTPGETRPVTPYLSAEDAIAATLRGFETAVQAGDVDTALTLYADTPDFEWLENGFVQYPDFAAMRAALEGIGAFQARIVITDLDVIELSRDLAHARYLYDQTLTLRPGQVISFRGAITAVFRKTDAGWQIVRGHTSTVPEVVE